MLHLASIARILILTTILAATSTPIRADNLLLNPGAEQGKGAKPSVWAVASVPADGLRMERSNVSRTGNNSLWISNHHRYDETVSNNWMQRVQQVPRGRTVQVSASIRTADAYAANVCLQCWDSSGEKMLAFASTPVFRGDQDWIRVSSEPIVVPEGTVKVYVRAALTGTGQAWFDDLEVSVDMNEPSATDDVTGLPVMPSVAATSSEPDLSKLVPGRVIRSLPMEQDCMILAYLPDWNHGILDNVAVANNDGGVRALLRWKPIPDEELSDSKRRFYLAVYSRKTTAKGEASEIKVHPVAEEWAERSSWKTQPQINDSAHVAAQFDNKDGWKLFDVTKLVTERTPANRFGVMLKFEEEEETYGGWSGYAIVSREGQGEWESRHPRLLVVQPTP